MTMNALAEETSSLLERLREVPAPEPMISTERKELTSRQREVLIQLSDLFDGVR